MLSIAPYDNIAAYAIEDDNDHNLLLLTIIVVAVFDQAE